MKTNNALALKDITKDLPSLEKLNQKNNKPQRKRFDQVDWRCVFSIILIHSSWLALPLFGVSLISMSTLAFMYVFILFGQMAGFHRYFTHHTYKTSRRFEIFLAVTGTMAGQRGPLWWIARHREHHLYADRPKDIHSPVQKGFWWSFMGWFFHKPIIQTYDPKMVAEWRNDKVMQWLDKNYKWVLFALFGFFFVIGAILSKTFPSLETSAFQMAFAGSFMAVSLVHLMTYLLSSVSHIWGKKRFNTKDESRNSLLLAILSLGEGWHNNHHRYSNSARVGFYWWEFDGIYYILKVLSFFGIVWDLKLPPQEIYNEAREGQHLKLLAK